MRRSLLSVLAVMLLAVFICACSINAAPDGENADGSKENDISTENNISTENEIIEKTEEESSFELAYGDGYYIDDDGNAITFPIRPPFVMYNGHEYAQYNNPWWNCDEDWLNENYTYIGDVKYCPDYAPEEERVDFTTNISEDGCKIYKCNDEDTFIFTLWGDGTVRLFVQSNLSREEVEDAEKTIDWKLD